jgi:hypothetical protein
MLFCCSPSHSGGSALSTSIRKRKREQRAFEKRLEQQQIESHGSQPELLSDVILPWEVPVHDPGSHSSDVKMLGDAAWGCYCISDGGQHKAYLWRQPVHSSSVRPSAVVYPLEADFDARLPYDANLVSLWDQEFQGDVSSSPGVVVVSPKGRVQCFEGADSSGAGPVKSVEFEDGGGIDLERNEDCTHVLCVNASRFFVGTSTGALWLAKISRVEARTKLQCRKLESKSFFGGFGKLLGMQAEPGSVKSVAIRHRGVALPSEDNEIYVLTDTALQCWSVPNTQKECLTHQLQVANIAPAELNNPTLLQMRCVSSDKLLVLMSGQTGSSNTQYFLRELNIEPKGQLQCASRPIPCMAVNGSESPRKAMLLVDRMETNAYVCHVDSPSSFSSWYQVGLCEHGSNQDMTPNFNVNAVVGVALLLTINPELAKSSCFTGIGSDHQMPGDGVHNGAGSQAPEEQSNADASRSFFMVPVAMEPKQFIEKSAKICNSNPQDKHNNSFSAQIPGTREALLLHFLDCKQVLHSKLLEQIKHQGQGYESARTTVLEHSRKLSAAIALCKFQVDTDAQKDKVKQAMAAALAKRGQKNPDSFYDQVTRVFDVLQYLPADSEPSLLRLRNDIFLTMLRACKHGDASPFLSSSEFSIQSIRKLLEEQITSINQQLGYGDLQSQDQSVLIPQIERQPMHQQLHELAEFYLEACEARAHTENHDHMNPHPEFSDAQRLCIDPFIDAGTSNVEVEDDTVKRQYRTWAQKFAERYGYSEGLVRLNYQIDLQQCPPQLLLSDAQDLRQDPGRQALASECDRDSKFAPVMFGWYVKGLSDKKGPAPFPQQLAELCHQPPRQHAALGAFFQDQELKEGPDHKPWMDLSWIHDISGTDPKYETAAHTLRTKQTQCNLKTRKHLLSMSVLSSKAANGSFTEARRQLVLVEAQIDLQSDAALLITAEDPEDGVKKTVLYPAGMEQPVLDRPACIARFPPQATQAPPIPNVPMEEIELFQMYHDHMESAMAVFGSAEEGLFGPSMRANEHGMREYLMRLCLNALRVSKHLSLQDQQAADILCRILALAVKVDVRNWANTGAQGTFLVDVKKRFKRHKNTSGEEQVAVGACLPSTAALRRNFLFSITGSV